ncbi:MAG: hypothetical protein WBQ14_06060 [Gaiellaceae bacterium]
MSEELKRDAILGAGPNDGSWTDVIRRAKRARRRQGIYGVVLLTALAVVGVASAYALGHPIVDFNAAEKAPAKAVVEFQSMEPAGPSWQFGVLPDQARMIPGLYLNGTPFKLYVAPTASGGFCSSRAGCIPDRAEFERRIGWQFHPDLIPMQIRGAFINSAGERIELSYANGTNEEIPFVWVTAPIDAGFFVVGVPQEHQNSTSRPTALTLYDGQGKVLAHETIANPWDQSP